MTPEQTTAVAYITQWYQGVDPQAILIDWLVPVLICAVALRLFGSFRRRA